MRLALLSLALLALPGCDSGAGRTSRLELVVNQTRFAPGDEALVVLDNDTGRQEAFSPCLVLLGPNSSQPVSDGAACSSFAATIRPGQSIPMRFQLPANLEPGLYALALDSGLVRDLGPSQSVVSGRFEVVARR